ncbi:MAG: YncE family protein [Candidatus Xenobium sp.]|nr:YncE family protein [Burkholderiales bacterium]
MIRAILLLLSTTLVLAWGLPVKAQIPASRVGVTCALDGNLVLIDAHSIRVTHRLGVCRNPGALAVSPDGRMLLVAEGGGTALALVDLLSVRLQAPVRSDHLFDSRALTFSKDGSRLYLLNPRLQALLELQVPSFKTARLMPLHLPGPQALTLSPDGGRLFIAHGEAGTVSVVDLAAWQLLGQHRLADRIGGMDVTADGTRMLVALPESQEIGIYDIQRFIPQDRVPVGQEPSVVRIGPDGRAVVINSINHDVSVFDPERPSGRFRIGVGIGPRDLTFSPDGGACFVANYDTGDISVLNLKEGRQLGRLAVGKGPKALTWIP